MSKKNKEPVYTKEEQQLVDAGILKDGSIRDPNFRWSKNLEQAEADKQYSEQKLKEAEEREMARLTRPSMFEKGIDAIARLVNRKKAKAKEKEQQKKAQMQKIAQERIQKSA